VNLALPIPDLAPSMKYYGAIESRNRQVARVNAWVN
jgi:hypothetical protein